MAKKVTAEVKLQIPAGKATPAPPVAPRSDPGRQHHGILQGFQCEDLGEGSRRIDHSGRHHYFSDRSLLHHQDASRSHLGKARRESGQSSAEPNKTKVGKITEKQIEEIAKIKMPDLNCFTLDAAVAQVKGACRSMASKSAESKQLVAFLY